MPTYQYVCTSCGTKLEVIQSFSDDPLVTCDDCEGPLRKVFSPVGIVFKGSGFYRTDSRSDSATDKVSSTASKKDSAATSSASKEGSATTASPSSASGASSTSSTTSTSGGSTTPSKGSGGTPSSAP